MVNATIKLMKDIGLYASYGRTIDFTSKQAQNNWFASKNGLSIQANYNKTQNAFQCEMDYGQALTYTYARIDGLDRSGMPYYYFVKNVELIRETDTSNIVAFTLAMDPIQTFMFMADGTRGWTLGESFVVQEHVDRWSKTSDYPSYVESFPLSMNAQYEVINSKPYLSTFGDKTIKWVHIMEHVPAGANVVHIFPACTDGSYVKTKEGSFPNLMSVWTNRIFQTLNIDPERITGIAITDVCMFRPTYLNNPDSDLQSIQLNIPTSQYLNTFEEPNLVSNWLVFQIDLSSYFGNTGGTIYLDNLVWFNDFGETISRPTKPTDGASASPDFEPALFMDPFIKRTINTASNLVFSDIPDIILYRQGNLRLGFANSPNDHYYVVTYVRSVNLETPENKTKILNQAQTEGLLWVGNAPLADLFTNNWLTYTLTERAEDRQILVNNAYAEAIQGAIYGGYGGALVGSRGGIDKGAKSGALFGASAIGAIGSMAGSIVNSYFQFQNQNMEEQKIKNRANKTSMLGSGAIPNATMGLDALTFSEVRCDDTHYQKGYEWFTRYGYQVNRAEVPNIRSRKFFNFIQTAGCIVQGPLNQDIRDTIASIFDSGITIFHGDYTTSMEYPTQENIERSLL